MDMASEPEKDTSRSVVQVYLPAYQRDEWDKHADELGMSRSEYVKTMVQAGRRGFGGDPVVEHQTGDAGESETATDLEERIVDALEDGPVLSWDELMAAVTGDIESRLETALQDLQDDGTIRHSGREGGYVLEDT